MPANGNDDFNENGDTGGGTTGGSSSGSGAANRGIEVRFRDRVTGRRIAFDPATLTGAVSYSLTASGGTDQITASVTKAFDSDDLPLGCIMEFVYHQSGDLPVAGRSEPYPRVRGILSLPEATLDLTEGRTLLAYGFQEDMNHVPLSGTLPATGGGDLSLLAAQVLARYAAARPGFDYEADISPVGVTRYSVNIDNGTCRSAMDTLAGEAPGLVVWGWDVNPLTGKNRFRFKAKTSVVGAMFAAGHTVKVYRRPRELSPVVNAIRLVGGAALYPNLLGSVTGNNTGFETAQVAGSSAVVAPFLAAPGFESSSPWTLSGGARITGPNAGATFAGANLLDCNGDAATGTQTVSGLSITTGDVWEFSVQTRKNGAPDTRAGAIRLYFLSSSDAVLAEADLAFTDATVSWRERRVSCAAPAGAANIKVSMESGVGFGSIFYDAANLSKLTQTLPAGWLLRTFGTARFTVVDALYPDNAPDDASGARCLRVAGTFADANGQDGHLEAYSSGTTEDGEAYVPCKPYQTLRARVRLKRTNPGVTSGKMLLEIHDYRADKSPIDVVRQEIGAGTLTDAWGTFEATRLTGSDAAYAICYLTFRGDTDVLIDAFELCDASGGDFLRGDNFERRVAASDVCDAGSPAQTSATDYGVREATVENKLLHEWNAEAQAWAKAYLTRSAVPPERARLELTDEDGRRQPVDPLAGTLVKIVGTKKAIPPAYPARAEYRYDENGSESVSADLGDERPTMARLLAFTTERKSL